MTKLPPNPKIEDLPEGALAGLRLQAIAHGQPQVVEAVERELERRSKPERRRR